MKRKLSNKTKTDKPKQPEKPAEFAELVKYKAAFVSQRQKDGQDYTQLVFENEDGKMLSLCRDPKLLKSLVKGKRYVVKGWQYNVGDKYYTRDAAIKVASIKRPLIISGVSFAAVLLLGGSVLAFTQHSPSTKPVAHYSFDSNGSTSDSSSDDDGWDTPTKKSSTNKKDDKKDDNVKTTTTTKSNTVVIPANAGSGVVVDDSKPKPKTGGTDPSPSPDPSPTPPPASPPAPPASPPAPPASPPAPPASPPAPPPPPPTE